MKYSYHTKSYKIPNIVHTEFNENLTSAFKDFPGSPQILLRRYPSIRYLLHGDWEDPYVLINIFKSSNYISMELCVDKYWYLVVVIYNFIT